MFLKRSNKKSKKFRETPDEELILMFKKSGDSYYIGELFERYTHLVFGLCMKYLKNEDDSKDAVMQIFESLNFKLKEHKIENFKSWLYSVAKNHCLMHLRKEKSSAKMKDQVYQKLHSEIMELQLDGHPINSAENDDNIPVMMKGLETLKKEQRTCLELLYLQNKSYREVADITGYSMKKVKSHIQNGKRNLKIYMEKK